MTIKCKTCGEKVDEGCHKDIAGHENLCCVCFLEKVEDELK